MIVAARARLSRSRFWVLVRSVETAHSPACPPLVRTEPATRILIKSSISFIKANRSVLITDSCASHFDCLHSLHARSHDHTNAISWCVRANPGRLGNEEAKAVVPFAIGFGVRTRAEHDREVSKTEVGLACLHGGGADPARGSRALSLAALTSSKAGLPGFRRSECAGDPASDHTRGRFRPTG